MKNNSIKKLLALVLAFVLTAAAALAGCSTTPAETTAPPAETQPVTTLGEGSKVEANAVVGGTDKEKISVTAKGAVVAAGSHLAPGEML